VPSRRALTMVEVLISVTIISLAMLPIIYMQSRNVETARLDRVRVAAEALCHNTLERYGRAEDNVRRALVQNPSNPNEFSGLNLFATSPHLADVLGANVIEALKLVEQQDLGQLVTLTLDRPAGMNTLRCRVFWTSDRERTRRQESVEYVRYIAHD
jgi:type II secretory pathway pseudopilin PulG